MLPSFAGSAAERWPEVGARLRRALGRDVVSPLPWRSPCGERGQPLVRRNLVFGAGFVTFAPGLGPGGEVACGDVHVGLGHEVLQEVDIV